MEWGLEIGGSRREEEVFDMLAKTGCTMWSGCQGVKSGRFAQDDRRLRFSRHDGDAVPGTQRSAQDPEGTRSPRHDLHPHDIPFPIAQTADSHSQCERQVAHQRPVQSAPSALSAGAFGTDGGTLFARALWHSRTRRLLAGPSPARERSRDGRTSREPS